MAPKQRAKQLEQLAATLRAGEVEMPPPSEVPVKRQRLKGGGANGKENTPEEPPANPTEVEEEPEKPKKESKKKKKTEDTKTEVTNTTDTGNGSKPAAPKQKRPLEETAEAEVPKAKAKAKTAPRAKAKSKMNEAPDFEVCWENHAKLMAFYDLTEEEATTCLLSVVGEDEAGRKFWGKFRTNKDKDTPKNDNEHPMGPGKPISRAERELLEDSQLPEYEHEDTDLDSNLDGSGSSMDQLETQLVEELEKVLPTPTPTPPAPVFQVWCFKSI